MQGQIFFGAANSYHFRSSFLTMELSLFSNAILKFSFQISQISWSDTVFLRVLLLRFFLNLSFAVYSSDSSDGYLFFVSPLFFPISNLLLFACYRCCWLA